MAELIAQGRKLWERFGVGRPSPDVKLEPSEDLQEPFGLSREFIATVISELDQVQKPKDKETRLNEILNGEYWGFRKLSDEARFTQALDWVGLYDLLVNGKLEELYSNFQEQGGRSVRPIERFIGSRKQSQDRVSLAIKYLNNIQMEERQFAHTPDAPTIGIEIEHHTHEPGSEKLHPLSFFSTLEMAHGSHATYRGTGDDYVGEIRTHPVFSPKTMHYLLEVMTRSGFDLFSHRWSTHETMGGVNLGLENTQVMDATAIGTAAEYIPWRNIGRSAYRMITEKHKKGSKLLEVGYSYFPFHKLRELWGLSTYGAYGKQSKLVERRGLPHFKRGQFERMKEQQTFSWLTSWGLRAVQMNERQRNPLWQECASAWEDLMVGWNALLNRYHILNPPDSGRVSLDEDEKITEYNHFLATIRTTCLRQPEFKQRARELSETYSQRVAGVIGFEMD